MTIIELKNRLTIDFRQKLEISSLFFLFFFFLTKLISLEIMPHDHLVWKQALLDYKKWILRSYQIRIFLKGLSHDFGQKITILYLFVSGQNGPGNTVLMIIEVKTSSPTLQKYGFYIDIILVFFKGVNPWFWSQNGNFIFVCFWTKWTWK